jgi:hypothetical protein
VIDDQVVAVNAYLEVALTRRAGAWWHAERRFGMRRFADGEVLDTPERLQLLASLNALRPAGLLPVTGPQLEAFLGRAPRLV